MRLEIATSERRLGELEPSWWRLWHAARHTTPFQTPAWQIPWFRCFAAGSELRLLAVHSSEGLEGLLPLISFQWRGQRWVSALGTGISDYLDVLLGRRDEHEVLKALQEGLAIVAREVDRLEIEDVPTTSPLCRLAGTGTGISLARHAVCPVVSLGEELAPYFRALPKSLRRSLRRGRRGLEGSGGFAWRRADAKNLDSMLDQLFLLHAARWQARGQDGVLADSAVQGFHRESAPRLLRAGLLRLLLLEIAGTPAGAAYVLSAADAYLYLSGFRPELRARGIGNLLIERALCDAHALGKRRCDFLRGSESYKYDWRARDESTLRISIKGGIG